MPVIAQKDVMTHCSLLYEMTFGNMIRGELKLWLICTLPHALAGLV